MDGVTEMYKHTPLKVELKDLEVETIKTAALELIEEHKKITGDVFEVFEKIDTDKSGFIDRTELISVIQQLGLEVAPEDYKGIFEELDLNNDGEISPAEFLAWHLSGRSGTTPGMKKFFKAAYASFNLLKQTHDTVTEVLKNDGR